MTIPRKTLPELCAAGVFLFSMVAAVSADQVEMQNGDRYNGSVLSLNADTVTLHSDVLGTVHLPRGKVALIALGTSAPAHPAQANTAPATNTTPSRIPAPPAGADPDLAAALRQLGSNTNLIQQVQAQFLAGAGPEANSKFTELLGGLSSGKLGINELRTEAKSAADQLRALKREPGEGSNSEIDGYLSILEDFLKETAPAGGSGASSAVHAPQSTPDPAAQH
ncbi:MAG: hypothetical protein ABSA69_06345 [Verrucomicrobiota bacterium]|jgi:hypothetical protein